MVFDGILLAILVGFLRKGNLKGFGDLHIKHGWVFPVLLLSQWVIFLLQNKYELLGTVSNYIFIGIYIVGLTLLWVNRKLGLGIWLILIGVLLNFVVMGANGGRMPVSLEAAGVLDPAYGQALQEGYYGKHTPLTEDTKFGFLGDVIPLPEFYPRDQVISIGDIIMNIGIFLFIQMLMVNKLQTRNRWSLLRKGGEEHVS
ncbi:DUF5317 domain-containing protein [Pseudalkalibacillus berkeleyi]|uniref:DUF5317 domain-containing protein n=1 Tax=Pseudalkalibacillus berkeleyi TaxID=1069813 RepID=A0ABS9H568_9BACL|nr:DUF5317 domain-containing protein [Pseudalkalibacillus berkeleyi]MCF6138835.1 DUF5317 domain-containing protein [Pseudalkalibacillus berkeleyi]